MKDYLIVFMEESFNIGNIIVEGKNPISSENIGEIKEKIKEEFGHDPKKTVIINIISLNNPENNNSHQQEKVSKQSGLADGKRFSGSSPSNRIRKPAGASISPKTTGEKYD